MLTSVEKQQIDEGDYTIERKEEKETRVPIEVDRAVSVNDLYEGYIPSSDKNVQLLGDLLSLPYTLQSLSEYFYIVASNPQYRYYSKIQDTKPDPETRLGRIFLKETDGYLYPEYSYLVFVQTGNILKYSFSKGQIKRFTDINSLDNREFSILQSLYDVKTRLEVFQKDQHPIESYLLYSRDNKILSVLKPFLKGIGMLLPSYLQQENVYSYILDNIILYQEVVDRKELYVQTMTDEEILEYLGPQTQYVDRLDLVKQMDLFLTIVRPSFFLSYHSLPSTYNKLDMFGRELISFPILLYGNMEKNRRIGLDELLKKWQTAPFSRIEQEGEYNDEELKKLLDILPKLESVFSDDLEILIKDRLFPKVVSETE